MTNAVVTVDHRNGAGIDNELGFGHWFHHAVADAIEIPTEAQHAVRLMSPEVGLHQRVSYKARVALRHASAGVDGSGEIKKLLRINTRRGVHRYPPFYSILNPQSCIPLYSGLIPDDCTTFAYSAVSLRICAASCSPGAANTSPPWLAMRSRTSLRAITVIRSA